METLEIIDFYRIKFKHSLVGRWTTAEGTFRMQTDAFEFFEDGTGIWISSDARKEDKINFDWREKAPLTIDIWALQ